MDFIIQSRIVKKGEHSQEQLNTEVEISAKKPQAEETEDGTEKFLRNLQFGTSPLSPFPTLKYKTLGMVSGAVVSRSHKVPHKLTDSSTLKQRKPDVFDIPVPDFPTSPVHAHLPDSYELPVKCLATGTKRSWDRKSSVEKHLKQLKSLVAKRCRPAMSPVSWSAEAVSQQNKQFASTGINTDISVGASTSSICCLCGSSTSGDSNSLHSVCLPVRDDVTQRKVSFLSEVFQASQLSRGVFGEE